MIRPAGYLVWVHGANAEQLAAIDTVNDRLIESGHVVNFCAPASRRHKLPDAIIPGPANPDELLSRWKPDLIVWCDSNIAHPILLRAHRRRIASVLIDAGRDGHMPRPGWGLPGKMGRRLAQFTAIYSPSKEISQQLRKLGAPEEIVKTVGLFRNPPAPQFAQRTPEVSAQIATRPAWSAAMVPSAELTQVIGAHRLASRYAHRLVLLLQLSAESSVDRCFQTLKRAHLRGVLYEPGVQIEETHQVVLRHASEPCPDWIGATPITYLGGSLTTGAAMPPCLPASLGSAVMHGPRHGAFSTEIQSLLQADASVPVLHGAGLAENLSALLGPDLAANYIYAAWRALTDAEFATNSLIDLIIDSQSEMGNRYAHT